MEGLYVVLWRDSDMEKPDVMVAHFASEDSASRWAWKIALGKLPHPTRPQRIADDGAAMMPYSSDGEITVAFCPNLMIVKEDGDD